MAEHSTIEWTDATWNPVTGCTKVSPGCKHCYAEKFAERFRGVAGHPYEQGFDLKLWPDRLLLPLTWKTPRMIFVNSMSDLFQEQVPDEYVRRVFDVMERASIHTFQLLTKRSLRMAEWAEQRYSLRPQPGRRLWPRNVWAGVSLETQAWVIVGGESGPGARPMDPQWARDVRDACADADVAFFFKQWGAHDVKGRRVGKKQAGRRLDGRTWDEMPASLEAGA